MAEKSKAAVVLLQFGGPDSLEAVEPFLFNLFNDPYIVELPFGDRAQRLFARYLSKKRTADVRGHYGEMGGKSPIVEKTWEQLKALQEMLSTTYAKRPIDVVLAMRYWKPYTKEAVEQLKAAGIKDVVLLPLYAQYSKTNAGSSYAEWDAVKRQMGVSFNERRIISYHLHPKYIAALNDRLDAALAKLPHPEKATILFSAHGTPVDMMMNGDPYAQHVKETMEAMLAARKNTLPYHLAFQSQVGPKLWLKPATTDFLKELGAKGVKDLVIVPISFVSDHIETVHELDHEERENAEHAGIENYVVMEGLNDHPMFIEALADLAIAELEKL
jgi:ferrochelatase